MFPTPCVAMTLGIEDLLLWELPGTMEPLRTYGGIYLWRKANTSRPQLGLHGVA